MDWTGVQVRQICSDHAFSDLTVDCVAGLQHDLFAGIRFHKRWNVGMPSVVSRVGLLLECLTSLDFYDFHVASSRLALIQIEPVLKRRSKSVNLCGEAILDELSVESQ